MTILSQLPLSFRRSLNDVLGEVALGFEVLDHLLQQINGGLGVVVFEAQLGDGGAVESGGVVLQQLFVQVRRQRRVLNASSLGHVTPRLQVLVVGDFSDVLERHLGGNAGHDLTDEASLNAEDLFQHFVHLALICRTAG